MVQWRKIQQDRDRESGRNKIAQAHKKPDFKIT